MENEDKKVNFLLHVGQFYYQGMIQLGKMENPITKVVEKNLQGTQVTIDTLQMLEQKTKGNLTNEESEYLQSSLSNLRLAYVNEMNNADIKK